jgi:hypothetical protein
MIRWSRRPRKLRKLSMSTVRRRRTTMRKSKMMFISQIIGLKRGRWPKETFRCYSRESNRRKSTTRGFNVADKARLSFMVLRFSCSTWTQVHTFKFQNCKQNSTRTVSNLRCPTTQHLAALFSTYCLDINTDRKVIRLRTKIIFSF